MVGEVFGRNQPGNRGQLLGFYIRSELMQYVAFGYLNLPFGIAILICECRERAVIRVVNVGGKSFFVKIFFLLRQLRIRFRRVRNQIFLNYFQPLLLSG